jgi:hypothetical protein
MISMPSASTTGRSAAKYRGGDGDVLQVDVLPDVQLGPVGQGKTLILSPLLSLPLYRFYGSGRRLLGAQR